MAISDTNAQFKLEVIWFEEDMRQQQNIWMTKRLATLSHTPNQIEWKTDENPIENGSTEKPTSLSFFCHVFPGCIGLAMRKETDA